MRVTRAILLILGTACLLVAAVFAAPPQTAHLTAARTNVTWAELTSTQQQAHHRHRWHTVASGDTLSAIAQRYYGHSTWWPGIYARNKHLIGENPNVIEVGQNLRLPRNPGRYPPPAAQTGSTVAKPLDPPVSTTPPPQQPVQASVPTGGVLSYSQLESLWVQAGGPAWAEASAASVAECESGGDTHAYNPSGASGLWQILGQVVSGYIFDPLVNALNAVSKFTASGDTFAQWVCQP